LRISKGPILKPFYSVKNQLNFFHLLFFYIFFCCFLFFCFNPSRYFPLLSFYTHLSFFKGQYEVSSFLSFCAHLFSFDGLYKASSLRFHSMRLRLEHHHCHRSSSCASLRLFVFGYQCFFPSFSFQVFSLIFFFLGLYFFNLFFPIFFYKFFLSILLFISTFARAYFFLECFCSFLVTLIFLIFGFYVLFIAIFSDALYVLLLQHNLCNTLYFFLMQIF